MEISGGLKDSSSFDVFEREAKSAGFDEVTERTWDANTELAEHTHPFDAQAVVVRGEMWLTCEGQTQHILPGGTFHLAKGIPHSERYGSLGATNWVARRNH